MGMFDTFSGFNDTCPTCDKVIKDYQTKNLFCDLKDWKLGEKFTMESHPDSDEDYKFKLNVVDGFVTGYDYCEKCKTEIHADIIIENGIVVRSQNVRNKKSIDIV